MNEQQLGLVFLREMDSPSQGVFRSKGQVSWMNYAADPRHRESHRVE